MKSLNELFYDVILLNELGGDVSAALRFSDASSKSGLSFGLTQLDVTHNDQAVVCLKECGFSGPEIALLQSKGAGWQALSKRLPPCAAIIEKYDTAQLSYCLNKALNFDMDFGIPVQSPGGILAGADYVNQYGSQGQGAVNYYDALKRPVTALDVLNFKLSCTKYGREHPDDCKRRYNNIMKVLAENV